MTWQTRASRTVYENRWIRVEENDVVGPHGEGIYGVVEMQHPAVFVVAVDDDDRVCLVSLERYTTGPPGRFRRAARTARTLSSRRSESSPRRPASRRHAGRRSGG
jgi:hypothetical protein